MARTAASTPEETSPIFLICGDDEFSVKQRARQLWEEWRAAENGLDQEVLDASAGNVEEALRRIGQLREALQTLPFFGGAKLIWFRECSFLGEDRTSQSATVTDALAELAEEWKTFRWDGLRLLISAGKPDKRRIFFKTLEKIGRVEFFGALADDKDWADRVESESLRQFRAAGKTMADEAVGEFVARVGPNLRALANEVEKLTLYVGDRKEVTLEDVQTLTPLQKLAEAFGLGEAVGSRDLVRSLRVLDEELWTIRTGVDKKRSEIGLVYGLISKFRLLLLMKELHRAGRVRPARDYNAFRSQVALIDSSELPSDKRFNPLAGNPYPAFQASKQIGHWTSDELVRAMDILLEANVQLVASGLDEAVVLQRAIVEIIGVAPTDKGEREPR